MSQCFVKTWKGFAKALKVINFFSFCVVLGACASKNLDKRSTSVIVPDLVAHVADAKALLSVNSIAILPVAADADNDVEEFRPFLNNELDEAGHEALDTELITGKDLKISSSKNTASVREAALQTGKAAGVDGVLVTTIHTFAERNGSKVAADEPARIGFSMAMYRVKDGADVWSASYHVTDQALTDNLFKVKGKLEAGQGTGWASARDLASYGFRKALKDFSTRRREQFTRK